MPCSGPSNPTGASYLLPLCSTWAQRRGRTAVKRTEADLVTPASNTVLTDASDMPERPHRSDLKPPQSLCLTFADLHFLWGSAPAPLCHTRPWLSLCLCSPLPLPSCPCRPAPAGRGSPLWMLVAWADVPATAGLSVSTEVLCANLEHLLMMPRGKKTDLRQEPGPPRPTRVAGNCSTESREGLQDGTVWPEDNAGKCLERHICRAEDRSCHHSSLASPLQVCSPRSAAPLQLSLDVSPPHWFPHGPISQTPPCSGPLALARLPADRPRPQSCPALPLSPRLPARSSRAQFRAGPGLADPLAPGLETSQRAPCPAGAPSVLPSR